MEELPVHFRAPHTYPLMTVLLIQPSISNLALLQHQFASSKKFQKSIISLFGAKQEDNETLRAYVQRFNTTIFDVITAHQEVLVSAFTQGLCGGPLFESLAKKPAVDYLDVLTRTEKYMNLEDALLVRRSNRKRAFPPPAGARRKQKISRRFLDHGITYNIRKSYS
ncbi:UNVERIFIED_CONTAM: hypothetical protein Sradi_2064800 [Sesamum radiatum]|uniref:Retrotransposon gag domain-containing protein n=1 Tax=Sesamum radiatum TaxID=300843 RepID=A0AAW2THE9_SESRA